MSRGGGGGGRGGGGGGAVAVVGRTTQVTAIRKGTNEIKIKLNHDFEGLPGLQ